MRVASLLDKVGVDGGVGTDYRHQEKDKKIDMKLCWHIKSRWWWWC